MLPLSLGYDNDAETFLVMTMIIMKKINVTKKRQIDDFDANFFPTELRNDPRVCKKIPSWKQNLYIRSTVCRITKFVGV